MRLQIGYVSSAEPGAVDRVLAEVARRAAEAGLVLAGTVSPPCDTPADGKCRIVLQLLPDGSARDLSLALGTGAESCRLDAGALEQVALEVCARLPGAAGLIVNKFGKQEATGRGLVCAIGEAGSRGLPVLVGVQPPHLDSFLAFAEGNAQSLPVDEAEVLGWLRAACRSLATA